MDIELTNIELLNIITSTKYLKNISVGDINKFNSIFNDLLKKKIVKSEEDFYMYLSLLINNDNSNKNTNKGFLYCIFNKVYETYGNEVYKLGMTCKQSVQLRITQYITSYVDPCIIIHSVEISDAVIGENLLFQRLEECRYVQNREFFKGKYKIIQEMDNVCHKINNYYTLALAEYLGNNLKKYKNNQDCKNNSKTRFNEELHKNERFEYVNDLINKLGFVNFLNSGYATSKTIESDMFVTNVQTLLNESLFFTNTDNSRKFFNTTIGVINKIIKKYKLTINNDILSYKLLLGFFNTIFKEHNVCIKSDKSQRKNNCGRINTRKYFMQLNGPNPNIGL